MGNIILTGLLIYFSIGALLAGGALLINKSLRESLLRTTDAFAVHLLAQITFVILWFPFLIMYIRQFRKRKND